MTTQIAVRLPDDLVAYVDEVARDGGGSRAAVVTRALKLHQRQARAEHDARILERTGDYDDFDRLAGHNAVGD